MTYNVSPARNLMEPEAREKLAADLERQAALIEKATGVNPSAIKETVRDLRARAIRLRAGAKT